MGARAAGRVQPPADVAVQSAFGQLGADTERAERQMRERQEEERITHEENKRREAREHEEGKAEGAA